MKKFYFVFLLLTIFSYCKSETWSCVYEFNDETRQKIITRSGEEFLEIYEDFTSSYGQKIINENDSFIHLYLKFEVDEMVYITSLDKNKKTFVMVGLAYNDLTAIIEGNCTIF